MGTTEITDRKFYAIGTCWYGIKIDKRTSVPCGIDARYYDIFRNDNKLSSHGATPSQCMQVWLCENHKQSMEKDGFIVRLVVVSSEKF